MRPLHLHRGNPVPRRPSILSEEIRLGVQIAESIATPVLNQNEEAPEDLLMPSALSQGVRGSLAAVSRELWTEIASVAAIRIVTA